MYILFLIWGLLGQQYKIQVIVDNVSEIIDYYETDESIVHQKIELYSTLESEDFHAVLVEIRSQYPSIIINYSKLVDKLKKGCQKPSDEELSIVIPELLFNHNDGKFKYTFQSRVRNIFGYLEVEIKDSIFLEKKNQFFITSIGG